MNKEEFYKMIQDELLEYMPEEFKDHTIRIDEVNKTGDIRLHGVCLIKVTMVQLRSSIWSLTMRCIRKVWKRIGCFTASQISTAI